MGTVTGFVGPAFSREHLLPKLLGLCGDPAFQVRKACPPAIAELSKTFAGHPDFASIPADELVGFYHTLAEDQIWGVRKACAESMAAFSATLPVDLRYSRVTSWFTFLAEDQSRWVRSAAYKQLGKLIATFGPPPPGDNDGAPPPAAAAETHTVAIVSRARFARS